MHQRERAFEIRLVQVGIVGAELVGEEHALVDHGAARQSSTGSSRTPSAGVTLVDDAGNRLAQDVEPALEVVLARDRWARAR